MSIENPCGSCSEYRQTMLQYMMDLVGKESLRVLDGIETVYELMIAEGEEQDSETARMVRDNFCESCEGKSIYDTGTLKSELEVLRKFRKHLKEREPDEREKSLRHCQGLSRRKYYSTHTYWI